MRIVWPIVFLLAGCATLHAASFDCAKAKTPQEKAICASLALSTADEQMAAAYHAWLVAAEPQWTAGIRDSQRTWLNARQAQCGAELSLGQMQTCLSDAYRARIGDLGQMVQRLGGVTFVWRAITLTAPDEPGENPVGAPEVNPGFGTLGASWPQSTAGTPEWAAWNEAIEDATRKSAQSTGDSAAVEPSQWKAAADVDSETTVSIGTVGEQLAAATIATLWDGHGAHPDNGSVEFNWLLKQKRALRPEDIFLPTSGWDKWLQGRLDQYLHQALDAGLNQDYQSFLPPGEMQKVLQGIVINPNSWTLDGRGLTIVFQPYEVACYACTPSPVTIPWTDLKPYLQPGFVLPR